ncbi:MAG: recombination protein NinG [Ramlibacter sp.]|nr:recombination protein NinG [Ramlibacter sp.]
MRPTRCKQCKKRIEEQGRLLHEECVSPWYEANREKLKVKAAADKAKAARRDRVETKKKLESRKTPKQRAATAKAKAQVPFNAYIRLRDADLPCVSCATTNPPMLPGGQWDAGHFKSRGAYPELAFNEDNCHKQCKVCNAGSGKFAHKERTVTEKYEAELLRRIGPERLAALHAPHPPLHYTDDDWKAVEATYKAKLAALKKEKMLSHWTSIVDPSEALSIAANGQPGRVHVLADDFDLTQGCKSSKPGPKQDRAPGRSRIPVATGPVVLVAGAHIVYEPAGEFVMLIAGKRETVRLAIPRVAYTGEIVRPQEAQPVPSAPTVPRPDAVEREAQGVHLSICEQRLRVKQRRLDQQARKRSN